MTLPELVSTAAWALEAPRTRAPRAVSAIAILRMCDPPKVGVRYDRARILSVSRRFLLEIEEKMQDRAQLVRASELAVVPGGDAFRVEVDGHALGGLRLER